MFGFFRSRWKPKPKPNRFRFSVQFFNFSVLISRSFFGLWFGFSGRDGNQNRTVFDFRFGFTILVSRFFSVLVRFFPVKMETETESFSIFDSVFSVSVSRPP